jgi:hypothetical protein
VQALFEKYFLVQREAHLAADLGLCPKPRDFLGMAPVDQVRLILVARSTTMYTAG